MTGSVDESVDEVDEPSQHAGPCKRKHSNRRKQLFRHVTAVDSGEENESQTNSQFGFYFQIMENSCNSQQLIFSWCLTPDSASAAKMLSYDIWCRRVSPKVAIIQTNDP